ncbi:unnamed protein product [Colias eurytheme]|nr:unnamed protein product [Colias eurytheme]
MAVYNIVVLFLLAALVTANCQVVQGGAHIDQGGPHQIQGPRSTFMESEALQNPTNWTTCDITTDPKIFCHDCNTRLICKPVGGLLKMCRDPMRPYCNNGICSALPSVGCA